MDVDAELQMGFVIQVYTSLCVCLSFGKPKLDPAVRYKKCVTLRLKNITALQYR